MENGRADVVQQEENKEGGDKEGKCSALVDGAAEKKKGKQLELWTVEQKKKTRDRKRQK